MTTKIQSTQGKSSEAGFAAIVIAVVLVTVLSLVTIGFAELVRHEQANSLNRQLSKAAYYAAEAGINDAAKALAQGYTTPKKTCPPLPAGTTGPGSYLTNNVVSTNANGQSTYTCLLIYQAPLDVQFSSVGSQDDSAKSFVISAVDQTDGVTPANVNSFTISWQDEGGRQTFAPSSWSSHPFQTASNWTNAGNQVTGVLKLQLVPLRFLDRTSLTNNAYNAYLYPLTGVAGTVVTSDYNTGTGSNAGIILDGNCNTGNVRYCKVKIDVSSLGQSQFLMRLVSLYDNSSVTIDANGASGPVRVAGVQSLVDSTGKSQNVLRRVQVRVPNQGFTLPHYGIEALSGICKQLTVYPGYADSGCDGINN